MATIWAEYLQISSNFKLICVCDMTIRLTHKQTEEPTYLSHTEHPTSSVLGGQDTDCWPRLPSTLNRDTWDELLGAQPTFGWKMLISYPFSNRITCMSYTVYAIVLARILMYCGSCYWAIILFHETNVTYFRKCMIYKILCIQKMTHTHIKETSYQDLNHKCIIVCIPSVVSKWLQKFNKTTYKAIFSLTYVSYKFGSKALKRIAGITGAGLWLVLWRADITLMNNCKIWNFNHIRTLFLVTCL